MKYSVLWRTLSPQASALLKERGRFFMVHRPFRLAEIMTGLVRYGLEPKRMQMVHPYLDKEPNMVLIEAPARREFQDHRRKPLIVYREPRVYTDDILSIYDRI